MRSLFILLLTTLFMHFGAAAQQQKDTTTKPVFTFVEQMPEYPGGMSQLLAYIGQNIHYPDSARMANIQGRVFVKFVIDEYGNVGHVQVLRGIGYGCDEEAIRVVKAMPRWKPGHQQGKPVRVYFTLPITYRLEDDKPADSSAHQ